MIQRFPYYCLGVCVFLLVACIRKQEDMHHDSVAPTHHLSGAFDSLRQVPASEMEFIIGQTIYAPIYSEIYFMNDQSKILLGATLSIHNVDPDSVLVVTKVDYYDSKGKLLKKYLSKPGLLNPMETKDFVVDLMEKEGGTGANFLIEWRSAHKVSEPLVEAIMISASSSRGVSFVSRGKVVRQFGKF